MLFNSLEFLLLFMPLCVLLFYIVARWSKRAAVVQLLAFSLVFYGAWKLPYLTLLLASILFNFGVGRILQQKPSKKLLLAGVLLNLASIAYFKYLDFLIGIANQFLEANLPLLHIILPLGISFFTFQQISYLVECYKGRVKERDFISYALFVSFFPQLIAGPIVRFQEISYQFLDEKFGRLDWSKIALGLIIFSIGLSKKVFLADAVSVHATSVFDKADSGLQIAFIEAWFGAFAYSFQIYFDFSAYSDMAIGLGLMLGLILPLNFYSPYKARSVIDFWRTWHITLSRFLKDYLYIPLGGNRKGKLTRYLNLMIVMLLGGLWHGASWNFVIWGGLHGMYLMLNHGWRRGAEKLGKPVDFAPALQVIITFMCVTFAWVFFRAETFDGAVLMAQTMLTPDLGETLSNLVLVPKLAAMLLPSACIVWLMPNSIQIMRILQARLESPVGAAEKTILVPSVMAAIALALCVYFIFAGVYSEFIYFQF